MPHAAGQLAWAETRRHVQLHVNTHKRLLTVRK